MSKTVDERKELERLLGRYNESVKEVMQLITPYSSLSGYNKLEPHKKLQQEKRTLKEKIQKIEEKMLVIEEGYRQTVGKQNTRMKKITDKAIQKVAKIYNDALINLWERGVCDIKSTLKLMDKEVELLKETLEE